MTTAKKSRSTKSGERKSSAFRPKNARGQATNIANAIALKDDDLFLLCENNGNLPIESDQGFGIYFHDCRFLKGYELTIAGTRPNALSANAVHGYMAEFELTNHDLKQSKGGKIKKQSLRLHWQRIIQASQLCVQEVITCTNYTVEPLEFVLSFSFEADFEDIFEIRGLNPPKSGHKKSPVWHRGALTFSYDGADGLHRSVSIQISPRLQTRHRKGADIAMSLGPNESKVVQLAIRLKESPTKSSGNTANSTSAKSLVDRLHKSSEDWLREHCEMKSNSRLLNQVFQRSIQDLGTLRSVLDGKEYFSAGLPWYGALFGRDSIIASLQMLAFRPKMAEQTLRLMAQYQGKKTDDWRDEEPGKIMHELRVGELAHLNEIPQTPYYGSVDSTPLFLVLIARHANWTGDLSLFRQLRPAVDQAFDWISRYGDKNGDGYLTYDSKSKKGLGNQGWKDSGDAIVNTDGSLATPPIALVEVQGYVYLAKMTVAQLYERDGDHDAAQRLRAEAHELQTRFESDFWLENKATYALALQAGKKPAAVISSNPGQALWSGIAGADRADKTAKQLMSQAMFSGWGVRTLSSDERRFNPLGYHLGTVWPHDNSIIAAGLRKYGHDHAACAIFSGIVHSAKHFERYRLPEVFSGISRQQSSIPVRYPVACHPQAWAAGSVPFMIESLLGLVPKAFENRLEIVRPVLPAFIKRLELKRLKVGKSSADLKFERRADGSVDTHVIKVNGTLDVEISNRQAK